MQVRYRSESDISEAALDFLRKYHAIDTIPVPIENIIEFDLGLDIIPVPGLLRSHDIDGALSQDFSRIYVDEYVYNERPNRYRFTLAHEVGHLVLHKTELESDKISSINDWLEYAKHVVGVGDWFESQAFFFARHVLMPSHHLEVKFNQYLPEVDLLVEAARNNGINRSRYLDGAVTAMSRKISGAFAVSEDAARVRIVTHKLDNLIL